MEKVTVDGVLKFLHHGGEVRRFFRVRAQKFRLIGRRFIPGDVFFRPGAERVEDFPVDPLFSGQILAAAGDFHDMADNLRQVRILRNSGDIAAVAGKAAGSDYAVSIAAGVAENAVIIPNLCEVEGRGVWNAEVAEHHVGGGAQSRSLRGGNIDGIDAKIGGTQCRCRARPDVGEEPGNGPFYFVRADDTVVIVIDEVEELAVGAQCIDGDSGDGPEGFIQLQNAGQIVDVAQCQLRGSANPTEHHIGSFTGGCGHFSELPAVSVACCLPNKIFQYEVIYRVLRKSASVFFLFFSLFQLRGASSPVFRGRIRRAG